MRKVLIIIALLAIAPSLSAQKKLVWQLLEMTTYQTDGDQVANLNYTPQFPAVLETQFEGQEIVISGYLIPIDLEAGKYALSKNPFTSCFFCGNAGPETVMELNFAQDPGRFATDEYVMVKGILQLNRDGSGLFFVLNNAEIHG